MSYESEVLSDAPLLYARLDNDGVAASGDVLPDISGNAKDLALCYGNTGGGLQPIGQATAIETDPAGYALRTFNNGSSSAGNNYSYAFRSDDADLSVAGDFTLEGWAKPIDGSTSGTGPLFNKRGQYEIGHTPASSVGGSAACRFYFKVTLSDGSTHTLTASAFPPFENAWYYLVGGRSGNTLFFRVNYDFLLTLTVPALANQSAPASTGMPSAPCSVKQNAFVVGSMPFYDGQNHFDVDEVAFYDYALGASRILAHWQAAKLSLPLSCTIKVRASLSLDTDQIAPLDFPFAHNYGTPLGGQPVAIRETLTYNTLGNQSQPDYRQRVNAEPHGPERHLDYQITLDTPNQRARYHAALWRPGETFTAPVWTDWTTLTAQASGGANSLSLDTTKRDFEVGSYVGTCSDPYDPRTYQFFQIASVSDSSLGLASNIGTTIPNGSAAFPARLMGLEDAPLQATSHTADRETWNLSFRVLSTELSARRITAYTPAETYKSIERFTLSPATVGWLDEKGYQLNRRQGGRDDFLEAVDTGSPRTIPVRALLTTRDELSGFYGWLDARQGKAVPLWVVTGEADMEVTARTVNSITITSIDYTTRYNLHHARRDVEFLKTDSTYVRRRITATVDNGDGTETLTLNGAPPALADISRASFLRYCVCVSDTFELLYTRDLSEAGNHIVSCSFGFVELLTSPA